MKEFDRWSRRMGTVALLRYLGAEIGDRTHFEPGLHIQNALHGDCTNLKVGDDVYVGPEVLIDLKSAVTIENHVAIAGRVSIVTHQNVGSGPLSETFPPSDAPVVIRRGSFIGFGSTILQAVSVGPESVVGAGSVVVESIPERAVAVGVPAKVIRNILEAPPFP
jgi:acetyltransferase-like isoleucine patch superfamily enzyme